MAAVWRLLNPILYRQAAKIVLAHSSSGLKARWGTRRGQRLVCSKHGNLLLWLRVVAMQHGLLLSGLGVLLEEADGYLVVQKVFPGGPIFIENEEATKHDPDAVTVQVGDVLLTLGDREVKEMKEAQIKEAFRGPADSRVKLGFARRPVPAAEQSIQHFSLDVLRRSSVRDLGIKVKSTIRNNSPDKDKRLTGESGPGLTQSPAKGERKSWGQGSLHGDISQNLPAMSPAQSALGNSMSPAEIVQENSVLRESLISMGEQLEEAERSCDLSTTIVQRVQLLEDKLLETEFNLAVSRKQIQGDSLLSNENLQLKSMLGEARAAAALAMDERRQSAREAEQAQESVRLHVEQEEALRKELVETKFALAKSRTAEALLRKQLRIAELALKKRLTSDSSDVEPNRGFEVDSEFAFESRMRPGLPINADESVPHGEAEVKAMNLLEERDEWKYKYMELEGEMKSLRARVQTSLDFLSRPTGDNSFADTSLITTALFYSMAYINESLDEERGDTGKIRISPWVVSALNHVASVAQPPDRRDKSVLKMRDDIARASSDTSVCNSLFELGCLLSMANSFGDSLGSESIEGIVRDVSRHLGEVPRTISSTIQIANGAFDDAAILHHARKESSIDVLRFATFCLCSLSDWTLGRQALISSDAARKLVHIVSESSDECVLEFAVQCLSSCAEDAAGSSIVVVGAPTLCKMLKSRRFDFAPLFCMIARAASFFYSSRVLLLTVCPHFIPQSESSQKRACCRLQLIAKSQTC